MHMHGYSRHAVSVCLSVMFMDHVKTNKHIFKIFSPSVSHTNLVFPYQTGWRYSDGNPPNGGVECRWGIGRNRDSGLVAGYRGLLDVQSAKNIYQWWSWVTQLATHHWLSIDCWTYELRTDKTVTEDHAVEIAQSATHQRMFVCDGLQHGRICRREENIKEFNCTQWYIWSRNN